MDAQPEPEAVAAGLRLNVTIPVPLLCFVTRSEGEPISATCKSIRCFSGFLGELRSAIQLIFVLKLKSELWQELRSSSKTIYISNKSIRLNLSSSVIEFLSSEQH